MRATPPLDAAAAGPTGAESLAEAVASAVTGRVLPSVGVVEGVRSPRANPWASRNRSLVMELDTSSLEPVTVVVKIGRWSDRTRTGQRWGPAYEADVYELLSEFSGYDTPLLDRIDLEEETFLVLRWLDGALPLAKAPYPRGILAAAAWLGGFHRRAATLLGSPRARALTWYPEAPVDGWLTRMASTLLQIRPSEADLVEAVGSVAERVRSLLSTEPTLVHGDLYPANVLWFEEQVLPIDWEWAGICAGELDMAALTDGWPADVTDAALGSYRHARWSDPRGPGSDGRFAAARLFLAARRLGSDVAALRSTTVDHYLGELREALATLLRDAPPEGT